MKLINLSMQNVGAFHGITEIDFSSLGEIFLISGNTGSGKTTIFDAVTFALYGKLPGSRSSLELKRFRSDFARDDEESFVNLIFSINQDKYKVYRSLPQPYTKRDGTQGYKNSAASLHKQEGITSSGELNFSDTEEWTILSDSVDSVKDTIETLLGLNCDEFSRIVLLPQGEFADFLKLSSNERKEALSKLFPIGLYTSIIASAKDKSALYKSKIESLENRIKDLRNVYNEENGAEQEKALNQVILELKNQKAAFAEQLKSNIEEKQMYATLLSELANRAMHEKKVSLLMEKKNEIDGTAVIIKNARQALVLQSEIKNAQNAKKLLDDIEQRGKKLTEQLRETEQVHSSLESEKASIVKLEKDAEAISFALKDIQEAEDASLLYNELIGKKEQLTHSLKIKTDTLINIQNDIKDLEERQKHYSSLEKTYSTLIEKQLELEKKLNTIKEIYEKCLVKEQYTKELNTLQIRTREEKEVKEKLEKNIETAKKTLADFETEKEENLLRSEAYRLAQKLEKGKPCPVCGSIEHPQKAEETHHTAPLDEKIAAQKIMIKIAEDELKITDSQLSNLEGQMKAAEAGISRITTDISLHEAEERKTEILALLDQCNKEVQEQKAAKFENEENDKKLLVLNEKLIPLQNETVSIQNTLNLTEQDITRSRELFNKKMHTHTHLFKSLPFSDEQLGIACFSRDVLNTLSESKNSYEKEITLFNEQWRTIEERRTALSAQQKELANTLSLRIKEFEETRTLLEKSLEKTDFETAEDAQAAFIDESQIISLEEKIQAWNKEKDSLLALIENSKKQYPYSNDEIQSKLQKSEEAVQSIKESVSNIETALELRQKERVSLENTKALLISYDTELRVVQEEGGKFIKLYMLLSSQNPKKIPLDAWVLGLYLEEITQFASSRLNRISDGRYTLLLKTEDDGGKDKIKGLDLEIFDSFTGKKRPCATLSGGETFMASISLALALTDVVQSKAGGVSLDSLFIDEGFGSLDDASLEKALSILDEIREKRMVGLISHVGDLKSRINSQILVTKGQNGSRISICS